MNAKKVNHVSAADQSKRDADEAEKCFRYGVKSKIQAGENDNQYNRQNEYQGMLCAYQVFILPTPFNKIAFWQRFYHGIQPVLRFLYGTPKVAVAHVKQYSAP